MSDLDKLLDIRTSPEECSEILSKGPITEVYRSPEFADVAMNQIYRSSFLGNGNYGRVFRVTIQGFAIPLAVKAVWYQEGDQTYRVRAWLEAVNMLELERRSELLKIHIIPKVYAIWETGQKVNIVMDELDHFKPEQCL
jgi:hypothetical protein